MNTEHMETRVATLEEKARAQEAINAEFRLKLDLIVSGINRLEISGALAKRAECPAPGLCLDHKKSLEQMQLENNELKTFVIEQKGGWKFLIGIGAAASAAGAIITFILTHFHKAP